MINQHVLQSLHSLVLMSDVTTHDATIKCDNFIDDKTILCMFMKGKVARLEFKGSLYKSNQQVKPFLVPTPSTHPQRISHYVDDDWYTFLKERRKYQQSFWLNTHRIHRKIISYWMMSGGQENLCHSFIQCLPYSGSVIFPIQFSSNVIYDMT